jgi:adenine-specific DNA-methyltransferase
MQKLTSDDPETKSADSVAAGVEAVKVLFPEAFTEGKVDFEVLKQLLGGVVDERDEKYGLNWHGKRAARQLALTPSTGTLRPCPDESIDWDTTQNLMIEGDNLEVLKLLQKSYTGMVKMIYIDPPYNTGKDFVYTDNFRDGLQNYLDQTQQSEDGIRTSTNPDTSGRFHTTWLNMMLPRLEVARRLMSSDGVIFVSIDDREMPNLRLLLESVFGPENFVGQITWKNATDNNPSRIAVEHEYIICYARDISSVKPVWKSANAPLADILVAHGDHLIAEFGSEQAELQRNYTAWHRANKAMLGPLADYKFIDSNGVFAGSRSVHNPGKEGYRYEVYHPVTGRPCVQPLMGYRFPSSTMDKLLAENRIIFGEDETKLVELKIYASDYQDKLSSVLEFDGRRGANELKSLFGGSSIFSNPKPIALIADLISYSGIRDGIVLDFFAGSGTTGHAVLELNAADGGTRQFVLVQLPEALDPSDPKQAAGATLCASLQRPKNIAELTKERIRRASAAASSQDDTGADNGFRVFALDSSNIEAWEPDRDDLIGSLTDAIEHLKGDRTEHDILIEVLLKLGLQLTVQINEREIAGSTVYNVGAGTLLVCLAESVDPDDIEAIGLGIAAWHEELNPAGDSTVVFRDSAFTDDVVKTNLTAILEQHGLSTVRSL